MNITKGYKNTEVGVIPEDWEVKTLGEVAIFSNGKAHEQFIDENGDYIVVNSKFISTAGNVFKNSQQAISPLEKGDIVMVMSDIPNGKALAKCYLIDKNNKYTLNQRICAIKSEICDNIFLFYTLNRNKYFLSFDSGSGQTNLRRNEVLDCPLTIPTLAEQQRIAAALSAADDLINSLEALIAKKRNIKQGTMQTLLQPKEGWEVKRLGDVAEVIGGGTPSSFISTYWNGNINWFTPTEIGKNKYTFESVRKITKEGFLNCSGKMLPIGTILLTTRAGIGDLSILMKEGCTNQGFQSLIAKKDCNNEYLYYLMQTLKPILIQNASGSTFLEISPNKIKQIEILFPPLAEQTRIATILSDMDAEILGLETKLDKYRQIKLGMMQNLLTGKIRLL
jgi:type I restriction enzyme, S subunit